MFFMLGLCFGSLSSRMATIKDGLQLSDGVFGSALFAMSVGVVLSLPVSGWMIAKLGSRNVGVTAILANAVLLSLVPLASSVYQLAALLFVSGFSYSAVNVSNNTQASLSEALIGKTELPFFHGIWGLAGFVGAGFGALMIGQDFALSTHFGVISVIAFLAALACWRFLHDQPGAERVGRAFTMPDRRLFNYGLIVFFSMACEGIMYDWSVVYFQDVVSAERQLVGVGFMVFMGAMTVGRLLLNRVADRFGTRSTLQWSGGARLDRHGHDDRLSEPAGVDHWLLPCRSRHLYRHSAGGGGAAARSSSMAPSSAIAAVLTIGFLGTLIGPPLIGFLSEAFGLRYAFGACVVLAIGIILRAGKIPWQAPSVV